MCKSGVLSIVVSLLLLNLAGCNGSGDRPDLGLVSGTVKMDGKPLRGVAVTFLPVDGRPAIGKTDLYGKYTLTYIRDTPGCKIGPNRVEIGNSEGGSEEMEAEGDEVAQTRDKRGQYKIPLRYNVESELEADVKPGENVFDFNLET
jgi:hypothetical protein